MDFIQMKDENNHEMQQEEPHIYHLPIDEDKLAMKKLLCVAIVCIIFMIVEVMGGWLANSLAIMTDAAHLFSDVSGFFISIISILIGQIPADLRMSYGYYRAEIIGAISSVIFIWGLTIWLVTEAVGRILKPELVDSKIMLITACLGLLFNLLMMKILHGQGHDHSHGDSHGHSHGHNHNHAHSDNRNLNHDVDVELKSQTLTKAQQNGSLSKVQSKNHNHNDQKSNNHHDHSHDHHDHDDHHEDRHEDHDHHSHAGHQHSHNQADNHSHDHGNMNVRAAFIHLIGDSIQSVGVIIAAAIIFFKPEWYIIDPICTFFFSIIVIFTTLPITKDCITILMEATPNGFDIEKLKVDIQKIPTVLSFHDLHVWSLTNKKIALSVHISTTQPAQVLRATQNLCHRYKIYHTTIQVENPNENDVFDSLKCAQMKH